MDVDVEELVPFVGVQPVAHGRGGALAPRSQDDWHGAVQRGGDVRHFFQKVVPANRARNFNARRREEREAMHEKRREEALWRMEFDSEISELDKILFEGDAVYDPEAEFVHDLDAWLELQRSEEQEVYYGRTPGARGVHKRGPSDTLEDEEEERREIGHWIDEISHRKRKVPRYLGYMPNPMGVGTNVYQGAAVAEGVNIPGVNYLPPISEGNEESADEPPIPMSYDGVPVGGPPLPPDTNDVEMVEVEVPPSGVIIDVAAPGSGSGTTAIAVDNPFSKEELEKVLKKTRESPFKRKRKKERKYFHLPSFFRKR